MTATLIHELFEEYEKVSSELAKCRIALKALDSYLASIADREVGDLDFDRARDVIREALDNASN